MVSVYIVTHGKKFSGANPGMTEEGFREISALRSLLPADVTEVVCGTGCRHLDVAKALGLKPTRYTSAVGGPDSGEASVMDGPVDVVRLPDGTAVPYALYTTLSDGMEGMKKVIGELKNNSVVCAGRPSMIMLNMPESVSRSAAVYRVEVSELSDFGASEPHLIVFEVAAYGESEVHSV